eukprot:scaffold39766_cov17-Tisochrysis_lutea.AAC.2
MLLKTSFIDLNDAPSESVGGAPLTSVVFCRLLRRWAAERLEDESNKWISDMSKEQGRDQDCVHMGSCGTWSAERLEDESNKWINDTTQEHGRHFGWDLDDLFAEFDQSLAMSRRIFSQVPNPQHSRWQQGRGYKQASPSL